MPVSSEDFREALSRFPAGVTIVTVKSGETIHGLTVSAFVSVSPDPPLIAVLIDHRHRAYRILEEEGAVFAVNVLGEQHVELSNRFAWVKDEDRFAEGDWTEATTGAPILRDAATWLDCSIHDRIPAGTHSIYLGRVEATSPRSPGDAPLVYWNRGYRRLQLKDLDDS
jgi:flavin reductase